ncbi:uncharacterized protein N7446_013932 [Penicillium canescens]|uniref:Uncharacterized protein n=1 Tax=Penicillium canescens TaxID=5083 RepID=A0AAD6I101_PENCN|nr:uncharacterized protein N7446_013932 [Penicillium canescens]KAJ6023567.1 hypothetical protein N7460_013962 [Penicillium canescens]KAJ6025155.1 hypothetical protein N7444_012834 [Penicillium canescens]KAJ6042866.1 hypothetical protein N7446_013932 [Penicillium canescens]
MLAKAASLLTAASVVAMSSASPVTHTISKDVVVVGGGAAGAYAAVRLREDYGKSIALVEREARLGGAVDTWTDPKTGMPYELGVEAFLDYGNATTGKFVNYTSPTAAEQLAAFQRYVELCEKYEGMMLPGLWNFPTADNIPKDLLLNFGDFARKYEIEAAVPTIWDISASFPAPLARVYTGKARTLYVASHRNQDIYDRVSDTLSDDVLYSSTVVNATRTPNGVSIIAKGADGHQTEIRAKRLLIAIPLTVPNLTPFKLDKKELSVLSKTAYTQAYAGGVVSSNLPLNITIINSASRNWLGLPDLSLLQWYKNLDSPDRYHKVMMFGNQALDSDGSKALVEQSYRQLVGAGSLPEASGRGLEWLHFQCHGSVNIRASMEDLKAGFIQELYSLQGHLSTWYTGAAWSAQLHTPTWAFSDSVIPRLVEGL